MKKFSSYEIDTDKIIAVQWIYTEGLAPKDGVIQKIREGKPSSVMIYTEYHTFHLKGDDFKAYKNENTI
ncbi:hypothetical protein LCGC14_1238660 [marine sediment metagenome]|uniref:Uncharacterized protein n=1 Tax=marine sediment metagenome TaxID=412755 RepID=A0A0F9LTN2_9ZZZZ|nr:hypothetical protein [Pricia sp.]